MKLATWLRNRMRQDGLTARDLAEMAGFNTDTAYRILSGGSSNPVTIIAIADALNVSPGILLRLGGHDPDKLDIEGLREPIHPTLADLPPMQGEFVPWLIAARKACHLTASQLSQCLGEYNSVLVQRWERGETVPTPPSIVRVAVAFCIEPVDLLRFAGFEPERLNMAALLDKARGVIIPTTGNYAPKQLVGEPAEQCGVTCDDCARLIQCRAAVARGLPLPGEWADMRDVWRSASIAI